MATYFTDPRKATTFITRHKTSYWAELTRIHPRACLVRACAAAKATAGVPLGLGRSYPQSRTHSYPDDISAQSRLLTHPLPRIRSSTSRRESSFRTTPRLKVQCCGTSCILGTRLSPPPHLKKLMSVRLMLVTEYKLTKVSSY